MAVILSPPEKRGEWLPLEVEEVKGAKELKAKDHEVRLVRKENRGSE
jgi:hypothetical protein